MAEWILRTFMQTLEILKIKIYLVGLNFLKPTYFFLKTYILLTAIHCMDIFLIKIIYFLIFWNE